uniref:Uncharacterized protein n=1 Tax=Vespula pensylvanica TaxID=30213 RepID=A0A834P601_VESPE|nr:hypothetical protein H0235_006113 [Vespula pensylvanica]
MKRIKKELQQRQRQQQQQQLRGQLQFGMTMQVPHPMSNLSVAPTRDISVQPANHTPHLILLMRPAFKSKTFSQRPYHQSEIVSHQIYLAKFDLTSCVQKEQYFFLINL